jgi:putative nucleotidyltransferase with HDIG domain
VALSVLLADANQDWLTKIKPFLENKLYKVETALNGKAAQLAIYNHEFFACVINLNLRNHSALEVLKFIKASHKVVRIVIIVDRPELLTELNLSIDKLIKLGATEVLARPFEVQHVADVLEGQQSLKELVQTITVRNGQGEEVEVNSDDGNFTSIKIDEFFTGKALLFDVFIRLSNNKYVKILHSGDTFSRERINHYKEEKGVEHLYFLTADRRKYIQYLNYVTNTITNKKDISDATKIRMVNSTSDKFLEELYTEGLKPQVVELARQLGQSVYQMVQKQTDLWKVLRKWQELDANSYNHSTLVMIYSSAIIQQFEWQSSALLNTMAMASLFHDIGKMKLPKELIDKRPQDMTHEEILIYQTHPIEGAKMLEGHLMIKQSVRQIILQHHEAFDGTGFPNKIKANKVLSLANILSLCDTFAHIMTDQNLKPLEALKKLLGDAVLMSKFNSLIVEHFIKIFADPAKIGKEYKMPSNSRVVPSKKAS